MMLPGDYIAMKLTGEITTSASALSEGIFFDFLNNGLSADIIEYFGFERSFFPEVQPLFAPHGQLLPAIAEKLGLKPGIPVSYKAGDQPNNALSLNVLGPGEIAATAGTSGVIYGVGGELKYDKQSRINTFAHVNYTSEEKRTGVLLCINGVGSMYRWLKQCFGGAENYPQLNAEAATAPTGSEGLLVLPFGNGAERMLNNKIVGAHLLGIDLNKHSRAHIIRATLEGIASAFRYGLDIMRENGINPTVIRAGENNLFLSQLFTQTFVNITGVPVELYKNDGSVGAAIGAGIGAGIFKSAEEAFESFRPIRVVIPDSSSQLEPVYLRWKEELEKFL
jgi:xylulokinase